jgi:hypothetical protein
MALLSKDDGIEHKLGCGALSFVRCTFACGVEAINVHAVLLEIHFLLETNDKDRQTETLKSSRHLLASLLYLIVVSDFIESRSCCATLSCYICLPAVRGSRAEAAAEGQIRSIERWRRKLQLCHTICPSASIEWLNMPGHKNDWLNCDAAC